ncbi:malto-oligosyltrehalose synthase [Gordonia sp. (in: high G+C Gram-positive bacteria)]|jgi:(1->4)-alpha-D-glucan 1-alpha-D-glucosylmutase|uniref:malto-oligosyltrehalose synthase n=1 Tax=Gordonia sp. (in: high G+C Gram-positive bacteria) TaxID=84139 RepID=UPI001D658AB9|nr:malto-oligosyltrehalose synthase [Gordonia sp. (in: high G+C Gram-positive bacteria)]MCB1294115.1 malto-oligosyltrehalose synthase [Gordonia sp. (in: high G+C Gram-positive bacteria)]HMS76029.1 malto-oligosyltrehalose synthase [Gordonia sp. (in: high G+C Gram-positive bacteria)]HQV17597.1 malto-oligosyltrehalose synthase [Gordonia sp. (in: high G+C Gram-positive bacteria)]
MVSRSPVATYRIQLTPDFGFDEVIGVLPHIAGLGVSHLYLSPIGTAMPGSTHGYDWVPPPQVAEILGGLDGLTRLRGAATQFGLGIIIDIVPNHTGVADAMANPWFADLLAKGAASEFADFFDVDFSVDNGADGKIALPVLGADADPSDFTLDPDGTVLRYFDHAFPVAEGTGDGTPSQVHERQHYRLVPWNSGLVGYRRFFTVNELAGLRQEEPRVFAATHEWIAALLMADLIDGVRVDHPDGLWDPQGYLRDLRELLGDERLIYIEKVLAVDEPLEPTLPVDGTTGYEQLRTIDSVFVPSAGVVELAEIHDRVVGNPGDAAWITEAEHSRKLLTVTEMFPTEHRRLIRAIASSPPDERRLPDSEIADATAHLIAELGVYRADYPSLRTRLLYAADRVAADHPHLSGALATIADLTAQPGRVSSRLAQTCGAVTAKSVEDSIFYRTARLLSAQEVGGDPANPSMSANEFHGINIARARDWPAALTATSTHDTKRSEDVRARIAMIAQVPGRWSILVRTVWRDAPPPEPLTGYFLLQNIIGVWPVDDAGVPVAVLDTALRRRLRDYARKAAREGGIGTSWTAVDDGFETGLGIWINTVTTGQVAASISAFVGLIAPGWIQESLARKAIAVLGPGVPDIYQGTQWWDDSLVDPDNRRPVDYTRPPDRKTELLRLALSVRGRHPAAFGPGGNYLPLTADGPAANHVIAFARGSGDEPDVVVVTGRCTHRLDPSDTTVQLPEGTWKDAATGSTFTGPAPLSELRAQSPVAILERT